MLAAHNRQVVGSSPTRGAILFQLEAGLTPQAPRRETGLPYP
ncbi:hypothetical protein ACFLX8_02175 [Chloroflexota bacterium]